jgi:hypothetical protein
MLARRSRQISPDFRPAQDTFVTPILPLSSGRCVPRRASRWEVCEEQEMMHRIYRRWRVMSLPLLLALTMRDGALLGRERPTRDGNSVEFGGCCRDHQGRRKPTRSRR